MQGAEVELEKPLGRDLTGGVWLRYTDTEDDATGLKLPYQPEFTGQARLDYLDTAGWRIGLAYTFFGRRFADAANADELGSYGLLRLNVARQFNLHADVFVDVENALDREYQFYRAYPGPDVQVLGGVRYRF
jgi:outer membrane cobalamin receptor